MKILVYYLAVRNMTWNQANDLRTETITKLETKFPTMKSQMIVILQRDSDNDRMEVLDMSPQYYPPYQTVPNYPNTYPGYFPTVPFVATGVGVSNGGSSEGGGFIGEYGSHLRPEPKIRMKP